MENNNFLNIFDLSDDCLAEIFKLLETKDFLELYKVHRRFHPAIKSALKKVFIDIGSIDESQNDMEEIENFLDIFGNEIRNLSINALNLEPETVEYLIDRYCADGNVHHCRIDKYKIGKEFVKKNVKFFNSLKSLYIYDVKITVPAVKPFLRAIKKIKKLEVANFCKIDFYLLAKLSSMKAFETYESYACNNLTMAKIDKLPLLATVKKVTLNSSKLSGYLIEQFPNVENLTLVAMSDCESILSPVLRLKCLKKLALLFSARGVFRAIIAKLAESNTLEHLNICYDTSHEDNETDVNAILCKMTNLISLILSPVVPNSLKLPELAHNLKKLQRFEIIHPNDNPPDECIDEAALFEFIRLAENLRSLKLDRFLLKDDLTYEQLYERFANIRQTQNSQHVLYVDMLDKNHEPVFMQNNKWVQLTIKWYKIELGDDDDSGKLKLSRLLIYTRRSFHLFCFLFAD